MLVINRSSVLLIAFLSVGSFADKSQDFTEEVIEPYPEETMVVEEATDTASNNEGMTVQAAVASTTTSSSAPMNVKPSMTPHSTMSLPEYNKNNEFDFLYKYPAEVLDVQSVCPWRSKTDKGWLRITRTLEHGSHKLYAQWIRSSLSKTSKEAGVSEHKLLATIGIEEINKHAPYKFKMPKAQLISGACQLSTVLVNSQTKRPFKTKVFLKGPGDYSCEMSSIVTE